MRRLIVPAWRLLAAGMVLLLAGAAQASESAALNIVVDGKGVISRVNFLCEGSECDDLEKLTNAKVRNAGAVATGRNDDRNYALVGSPGYFGRIKLLIEQDDPDALWDAVNFSHEGANAMVVICKLIQSH